MTATSNPIRRRDAQEILCRANDRGKLHRAVQIQRQENGNAGHGHAHKERTDDPVEALRGR